VMTAIAVTRLVSCAQFVDLAFAQCDLVLVLGKGYFMLPLKLSDLSNSRVFVVLPSRAIGLEPFFCGRRFRAHIGIYVGTSFPTTRGAEPSARTHRAGVGGTGCASASDRVRTGGASLITSDTKMLSWVACPADRTMARNASTCAARLFRHSPGGVLQRNNELLLMEPFVYLLEAGVARVGAVTGRVFAGVPLLRPRVGPEQPPWLLVPSR